MKKTLGAMIAELRKQHGMTQLELAEKMGVEMPICRCAYDVLYEGKSVQSVLEQLMTRSKRYEEDESWI